MKWNRISLSTALCLGLGLSLSAAPPENPGSQRTDRAREAAERGRAQAEQRRDDRAASAREDRGASARQDRGTSAREDRGASARENREPSANRGGRLEIHGRPDTPGSDRGARPEGENPGLARSVLVNKGQNRLARINADKILTRRLAQVDRLRDIALENDNADLLARADELEQAARADFTRRTGESSEPTPDPTPDPGPTPDPDPTPETEDPAPEPTP